VTELTVSRRAALRGFVLVAVGGVVGYLLAHDSAAARRSSSLAAANGYGPSSSHTGRPLVAVDQVPSGGGVIVSGIVVTRDASGTVHAFSATCTHQGCTVNDVRNGVISCPCHGSRFDARTGAVVAGPAPRPLPPVTVQVQGGEVVRG
jgi:Rieske Fe-S protein